MEFISRIKRKRQLWRKFRTSNTMADYLAHRNFSNILGTDLKQAKDKFHNSLIDRGTKALYKYTRRLLSSKVSIPIVRGPDNSICQSDFDAAQVLAGVFQRSYSPNTTATPTLPNLNRHMILREVTFTENLVLEQINNLKIDSSPGPDNITSQILKNCAHLLAKPLSQIMQASFTQSELPTQWLTASVTPIFKKGDKLNPENYRPVSLLCICSKIMERIIVKLILPFLLNNNIIPPVQHGFIPGRSTVTNLIQSLNVWTQLLDKHQPVDIIYLDLSKAFDRVPRLMLLYKLERCGIGGLLLDWINAFLSNRQFKVKVGSSFSNWFDVYSGVPQGSVLGPILFLVYVADLHEIVDSQYMSYADDNKLYGNPVTDHALLQGDLVNIENWCTTWSLPLNNQKCSVLHLGSNNPHLSYHLSSGAMNAVSSQSDLGILVNCKLSWSDQTSAVVKKANTQIYLFKKAFCNPSPTLFLRLYKTYIRPKLEYGISVWNPHLVKDIMALERVQRSATKMIAGYRSLSYEDRLQRLRLPYMSERRIRGDLIHTYRIIHNHFSTDMSDLFTMNNDSRLRGHHFKLSHEKFHTSFRQHFLTNRVFHHWNSLPEDVVTAPSVNSFKNRYDRFRASGDHV